MLKEVKDSSEEVPSVGDAVFFKHYPEELRDSLLGSKQDFVSFLLGLQSMSFKDYALLTVHEKYGREYGFLLFEWLCGNGIFSKKELGYCPKLRKAPFVDAFEQLLRTPLCDKILIPYMIAYQAIK